MWLVLVLRGIDCTIRHASHLNRQKTYQTFGAGGCGLRLCILWLQRWLGEDLLGVVNAQWFHVKLVLSIRGKRSVMPKPAEKEAFESQINSACERRDGDEKGDPGGANDDRSVSWQPLLALL